jgi:hypothetical protein
MSTVMRSDEYSDETVMNTVMGSVMTVYDDEYSDEYSDDSFICIQGIGVGVSLILMM